MGATTGGIVYPDAGSGQTPDVHYAALCESADPRLVGIDESTRDAARRMGSQWRGSMTFVRAEQQHYVQTGQPYKSFGVASAGMDGLIPLADLLHATLVRPNDPYKTTDPLLDMMPRVLGWPAPKPGSYKPGGDAEDPFIVNGFSINVPKHPLSDTGKWLLLAQMTAQVYNTKWNAPAPSKDNPDDERAQTNLEMRIARRPGDEPTRIVYLIGPPQGYRRQTTSHVGVASVEGGGALSGDIRALRFPTGRNREFVISNPNNQCAGWVLGIPMRI